MAVRLVTVALLSAAIAPGWATAAGAPTLTSPAPFGSGGKALPIDFTLPEAAQAGSVQLTFTDFSDNAFTITFAGTEETSGQHRFPVDLSNPTGSAHVASGAAVPDGPYRLVSFTYKDVFGSPATVEFGDIPFAPPAFIVDTTPPALILPTAGTFAPNPMTVAFTLPGPTASGSVHVTFVGVGATRVLDLEDGVTSLMFDPNDPGASPSVTAVQGGTTIPDDTYAVTVSYQDTFGNPAATLGPNEGVIIDGTAPQISVAPASPLRQALPGPLADYTSLANVTDAHPGTVTQDPPVGTVVAPGVRTITLTATDAAGNTSSTTFDLDVRPQNPVSARTISTGDAAPGAGTFPGLPADAKIMSLGVPAIDDEGTVVFVAKWTSASAAKTSTGLFRSDACLALAGGDAGSIVPGAQWKNFSDPVVSGGHVVTIATLNGVKAVPAAIVGNLTGASLETIARVGDAAPGAGGAKFKAFKAVTVQDELGTPRIAFLASLVAGSGAPPVSGVNDYGLWYVEGGQSAILVMREGDSVAGKTIKTLVSFASGNGSPGCGRGTLVNSTVDGDPLVRTLAAFTDKTQGIVARNVDDGPPNVMLSLSGDAATGVDSGARFAIYGPPAGSEDESVAFLARLAIADGVTKADATGIFSGPDVNGKFAVVARVAGDASLAGAGAKFSILKDPVINEDGAIAFPATLAGVKGPRAQTLWWKPAAGALTLLAQGGARPGPDLPAAAQWKGFTSLAIAAGGPIFSGILAIGPGGVSKFNASGVWAYDSAGALRTLFRTGDTVGGKTVKSFSLLKASAGSAGVTRSFSNNAQVAWLATFTDKTQAIVTTDVP